MGVTRTPFSGPALCELEWFLRLFLAVFTLTASPLIFVEGSPRYPSHATRVCLLILFELLQHLSTKLFRHVASGTIVQDSEIQAKSRCFLQARWSEATIIYECFLISFSKCVCFFLHNCHVFQELWRVLKQNGRNWMFLFYKTYFPIETSEFLSGLAHGTLMVLCTCFS